jgi:hypothetical protein
MVGEHLVAVKPGGEAAAGGDGQARHADPPGKFFLCDGVCFRIAGVFLILGEPVVGQLGQVLGCKLPHGLVPGFTVGQQLLGGTAGTGPGGLALGIDFQRKAHILSAPLDLALEGIIVLVQLQLTQHLVLDHHRLVVLVQNGLKFRAVLMGINYLGDTPGPRHQILCPFFLHSADLQAADLLVMKAFPALITVSFLVGDWPLQPLLFGADLAGVTEHHAQRHNGHLPKVAPVVISAPNAAINQSDHFLLLGLVHLIEFFKHRRDPLYSSSSTAAAGLANSAGTCSNISR